MTTSPFSLGSESGSDFFDDEEEIVVCSDNEFDESGIDDDSFAADDTSSATESLMVPSEDSSGIQGGSGLQGDLRHLMLAIDAYVAQVANQQTDNGPVFSLPLPGFETLRPGPTLGEHFSVDAMNMATMLLEAAANQCEPRLVVGESTVRSIAHGLSLAIGNTSLDGFVGQGRYGEGRLVATILVNSDTGVVSAYAVAQLEPYLIADATTGVVLGSMLYHVTRGFAIDEISRNSVTDAARRPLLSSNMIPLE
ncbi:uncharacterized protein [Drosophila bipectinata]|uniref:uncharacterized protein n=1 Tax=Drosophila bipectinata TaxID=42026 RepID=UPI0038B267E0